MRQIDGAGSADAPASSAASGFRASSRNTGLGAQLARAILALAFALIALIPADSSAQSRRSGADHDHFLGGANRYGRAGVNRNDLSVYEGASRAARLREQAEETARALQREKKFSIPIPWESPEGERLVAVVEDRYLTETDLLRRLRLRLKDAEPIRHSDPMMRQQFEEDRRLSHVYDILDEWVEANVLAHAARKAGLAVTEAEVDAALEEFSQIGGEQAKQAQVELRMVGIPEEEIRAEVRDALAIEKFVMSYVREMDESYLRSIYEADPVEFHIPPRVRTFHVLYHPFDSTLDDKKRKRILGVMEDIQNELDNKEPDYEKIERILERNNLGGNWSIGNPGWISAAAPLHTGLHKVLFGLAPGSVTKPFQVEDTLHLIRILEREEGTEPTFEGSREQVELAVYEDTKLQLYEQLRKKLDVHMNAGGLNKWKEVSEEEYRLAMQAKERGLDPHTALSGESAPSPEAMQSLPQYAEPKSEPVPRREKAEEAPAVDLSILN